MTAHDAAVRTVAEAPIANAPTDLAAALDRITELEAALAARPNTTMWVDDYKRGWVDFYAGRKDRNAHQYDGPYRVGYFEASEVAAESARLAAEHGLAGEGT